MPKKQSWEILVIKILLAVYIIFCLIIAGLNYGYAPTASPEIQKLINTIWHIYENQFKTSLIVICSILTLRVVSKKRKPVMRKQNFIGIFIAALVIHIIGPMITGNSDMYFFSMPFPWTTTALQLAAEGSTFYQNHAPVWGVWGITAVFIFYGIITVVVFAGSLLLGRRWQCSTLCLFNGFASEVFSPAFPLIGKKKKIGKKTLVFFTILKWVGLVMAIGFFIFWGVIVGTKSGISPWMDVVGRVENMKYLIVELMMAMFFWVVFLGRGYCYYCPLGTVVSWIGRMSGQKIRTTKTECIDCKQCDKVCPMSITISDPAVAKTDLVHSRCVGCGHCVDACPKQTLEYTTNFLDFIRKKDR